MNGSFRHHINVADVALGHSPWGEEGEEKNQWENFLHDRKVAVALGRFWHFYLQPIRA